MFERLSSGQVLASGVGAFLAFTLFVIAAVGTPDIRSHHAPPSASAAVFSYA